VAASEAERLEPVNVTRVVDRQTSELPEDVVSLDVAVTPDTRIRANALLDDVIESVLMNAVEHNDDDPHVEVTVTQVADRIQIRVADDGPGIPDDLKERVFEREVATRQTAHGFGLYFVSVMMDLYGGNVWFEDNPESTAEHTTGGAVAVLEFQLADTPTEVHANDSTPTE
jgi:signal transduction histidine kinase